jgi:tetratricopeptide (TPR) repeat protein
MFISRALPPILAGIVAASIATPALGQTADSYYDFLMARRLEAQGDNTGALAALERAASSDPQAAEVKAEIASFQLRRGKRDEAEKAAREAIVLDDTNTEGHRVLGLIYAATADTFNGRAQAAQFAASAKQAIEHLEQAVSDVSGASDINLHYTLGRLYMRMGNTPKAIDALNRVVNQNPASVQGRLALAQAYASGNDLQGAISTLDIIVDDEPRVASTLAQYLEQAGLNKEAAATYTKALAVQPMSRELKFRRVAALFNAKDYAQAEKFAADAQVQHPDDLRFPRLRARALFETGATARALAVLEPTARAFPKDTPTQFALADMYNDAGRDMDAEKIMRQLLDADPANADILNYLGYMLANHGRQLDEAIRLVQKALEVDPGNPSYLDSLGWAYYHRGDLENAEKALTPAAAQLPDNATIQDHFGDVLAKRSRWQDAIAAWQRALDGDSGDINRAAVEKKIQDAKGRTNR